MTMTLDSIDPGWAWSPFVPDADTPWSRRLAAHLHRRAGFCASSGDLDETLRLTPVEAVERLVEVREPESFLREMDELGASTVATGKAENLPAWWVYRLLSTPAPLLEKLTLFWHGHFATSAARVDDAALMYAQNRRLRTHARGDFRQLVHEIARDPAMLLWLDSATNRKAHPNENFARELMELFCLGEGEYTEADVRELARCFTGWEIKLQQFRFNRFQHDAGEKTILGRRGPFTGEQGVDIVLAHDACPRFIVRKLIRYILFDEPAPPDRLLDPLAQHLVDGGWRIGPLLQRMLSSRLFFSPLVIARRVRSPVEFAIGTLRALEASTNTFDLARGLADLDQRLFYPPNVKGWDGGRSWINSSTLLARANLVRRLLDHDKTRFAGGTLTALTERCRRSRGTEVVDWLSELLLAAPPPADVRTHIARRIDDAPAARREQTLKDAVHLLATQPEYQLA